ncbi:hypothetical protein [Paludisphaera sp.]|uniref:hypothetical protein n=1 Tax=Paludisphaera sp. TaxID=2017432 RepID=UPI00301D81A9
MQFSSVSRVARGLLAPALLGLCAPTFVGCDNSTGTPPELSEAEIQQRQASEADARAKAYGKKGSPTGKSAGRAAAKPAQTAEPVGEPAEKPAGEPAEKPAP